MPFKWCCRVCGSTSNVLAQAIFDEDRFLLKNSIVELHLFLFIHNKWTNMALKSNEMITLYSVLVSGPRHWVVDVKGCLTLTWKFSLRDTQNT